KAGEPPRPLEPRTRFQNRVQGSSSLSTRRFRAKPASTFARGAVALCLRAAFAQNRHPLLRGALAATRTPERSLRQPSRGAGAVDPHPAVAAILDLEQHAGLRLSRDRRFERGPPPELRHSAFDDPHPTALQQAGADPDLGAVRIAHLTPIEV